MTPIRFVLIGNPHSKSNSRQLVTIGSKPRNIKSKEALEYERFTLAQIPYAARQRLAGPIKITMTIYYANRQSDLDESLILDLLQDRYAKVKTGDGERVLIQGGVYRNDNQVEHKDIRRGKKSDTPRVEVTVELIESLTEQADLLAPLVEQSRTARAQQTVDKAFRAASTGEIPF